MRRRVSWVFLFVISGLLVFTASSSHSAPPPQDSDFTMEGRITEKSAGKLTIASGDNIIFHVVYSDSTAVKKKDGSPGTAADLKTGVTIMVAGNLAESGEITAKAISIEDDAGSKR